MESNIERRANVCRFPDTKINCTGPSLMAQWVKTPNAKSDILRLIPNANVVEGENQFSQMSSSDLCKYRDLNIDIKEKDKLLQLDKKTEGSSLCIKLKQ